MTRVPYLTSRLQGFGSTIFARMSALAVETGSLNLGQGFPDWEPPPVVTDAAVAAINGGHNQYPPLLGIPALREAVARHQERFWGLRFDPAAEVLVTAGATEAIAAALLGLCETGDEVIAFDPSYDSYAAGIAMAGAVLRPVALRPDPESGRFGFDPDELRAAFGARTRLILLNTPHNPTGKVFDRDELGLIAELCRAHDVLAVTDEVYEHMVFGTGAHLPLAGFPGMAERTLTISSGGKTFSCTGWKVGWVCGPASLILPVLTAKQFLTFVNGGPFQPAIAAGLDQPDRFYTDLTDDLAAKRDRLTRYLDTAGFRVLPAEGTYFVCVDVRPLGFDDGVELALALPERAGVVAVPVSVFSQDPAGCAHLLRFCFAKSDEVLDEAGQRLVRAFAGSPGSPGFPA
ncbi:MAG: pyridoxal phosphate-dependent aminotransferase [Acidimicrobiales bacterium]